MEGGSRNSIFGNYENNPNFWLEPSHDPLVALESTFSWPLDNFSHHQSSFNNVTNEYNPNFYPGVSNSSTDVTNYYNEGVSELCTTPQETTRLALNNALNGVAYSSTTQGEINLDSHFNALMQGRSNFHIETIEKNGSFMPWIKGQWTVEEDMKLISLVNQYGNRKWAAIAEHMVGRIGKQCRERWHNHLRPDIKKDTNWSEEEERMLIEAHERLGNRWAEIAKYIPGRTENSIKNHWNATKRKQTSKRKIKRPERLKGLVQSNVLEDYIKNKYFNKGSSSSSNSSLNVNNIVTPNENWPQQVLHNNNDNNEDESMVPFNFEGLDEEIMNFLDVLFVNNDNHVNGNIIGSTNENANMPRHEEEEAEDDELFSPDSFLISNYTMFEGSSSNNMDSNLG